MNIVNGEVIVVEQQQGASTASSLTGGGLALITEVDVMSECAPHIIDSVLRCLNWDEEFNVFFRLHCPKFVNFRPELEMDCSLSASHTEFLSTLESTLMRQVQRVTCDPMIDSIRIFAAIGKNIRRAEGFTPDPLQTKVCSSIVEQLDRYMDFLQFGDMMRCKCEELYNSESSTALATVPSSGTALASSTDFSPAASTIGRDGLKNVRVLWDIENVPVQRRLGGLETVKRLHLFLESIGLYGDNIDCRITAFFAATKGAGSGNKVPENIVIDLDRAAVELVWVAAKREDADRKLATRIAHEMQVLPAKATTFVVISSDQDFRHQYQILRNAGYHVVVMHTADSSSKWCSTLELQVHQSFNFQDVLNAFDYERHRTPTGSFDSSGPPDGEGDKDSPAPDPGGKLKAKPPNYPNSSGKKKKRPGPSVCNQMFSAYPSHWYLGTCQRWTASFGFLSVNFENPLEIQSQQQLLQEKQAQGVDGVKSNGGEGVEVAPQQQQQVILQNSVFIPLKEDHPEKIPPGFSSIDTNIFMHRKCLPPPHHQLYPGDSIYVQLNVLHDKGPRVVNCKLLSTVPSPDQFGVGGAAPVVTPDNFPPIDSDLANSKTPSTTSLLPPI